MFNIVENNVYGFQGAGIFNTGKGGITDVQMSGIFNRAERIKGVQLSLVNAARYVEGAQVGIVNVANKVKGTQIGLVNVSYEMRGFPVGLINVYVGNFMHLQGWIDNKNYVFAGLQLGGRFLYTGGYAGFPLSSPERVLITGLGAGFHVRLRPFYIDIDASAKNVVVTPADG